MYLKLFRIKLKFHYDFFSCSKVMHIIESTILLDKESPLLTKNLDTSRGSVSLKVENEFDAYIISCGKALTAITSSLSKARLSLRMIDTRYVDSFSQGSEFKSAYIEMLIENTIIRVQSIYDRVLIFINKVLELGISNESIGHNLLITNENVKKFNLQEKLKAIHKACNDYRFIRNTVIHHDRYSERQLDELTLIINADHLSRKNDGRGFIPPEELRKIIEDYLGAKQEELSQYLDRIEQKLFEFYDAILPVYDYQKDKLRLFKK